jgi:hypothetical protein
MTARSLLIASLNDAYRRSLIGTTGQTVMTRAVANLPADTVARILEAVRTFSAFTKDNDPYHEHDFGQVVVDGDRFFFKFDYYDSAAMEFGAEDPAVCYRVLTIMRAEDY